MALSQTHLDLRSSLSDKITSLTTEALSLDPSVARRTAIGDVSIADGGAASTGETAVVVSALSELLDAESGNPDFGGVDPTFASSSIVGGNVGTAKINVAVVADVLPSPSIKLRPVVTGADIDVSAWATVTSAVSRAIGGLRHPQSQIAIGPIPASARAAFGPASYKLVVKNPLDTASAEVVSAGSASFSYAG